MLRELHASMIVLCGAVDGQEHNKEVYYERAIQTIEQQLQAFQRNLDEAAAFGGMPAGKAVDGDALEEGSDSEDDHLVDDDDDDLAAMEADRGEAAVAAYMHRCLCAPLPSLLPPASRGDHARACVLFISLQGTASHGHARLAECRRGTS
jgi:hypothetical protein